MKKTFVMAALFMSVLVFGQRKPDHSFSFEAKIQNILLNDYNGNLIVKQADKISSYNPQTNLIDWEIDENALVSKSNIEFAQKALDNLESMDITKIFKNDENIEFIEASPFIQSDINGKQVIINALNGEVVYSDIGKDYSVILSQYLKETNELLFLATKEKDVVCILYNLEDISEKWITQIATSESYLNSLKAMFSKSGMQRKDQIEAVGEDIYAIFNNRLYKLNAEDGELLWTYEEELNRFDLSQDNQHIIVVQSTGGLLSNREQLNVLNASNATPIWDKPITTKSVSYLEDWGDKILVAHYSGFNFYSYATGDKLWKKDPKGKDIKSVITIDKNYLYVSENEMLLIDANGEKLWKKFVEISDNKQDPVYYLDKIDNNRVFYLTSTYANMVDYTTGKQVWKKNVKLNEKRPTVFAMNPDTNMFLVYNDEKMYKFDPKDASERKLGALTKLKVKNDKTITGIELFDWGIALTGENDVIGVNLDGTERYHNIYKEPGAFTRKLTKTGGIIGTTFLSNKSSLQSGIANATVTVNYRDATGNLVTKTGDLLSESSKESLNRKAELNSNVSNAISASVLDKVKERHRSLKENNEFAYIFARGDSKESNYIVKVRKSNGEEVDKITIESLKPIYEVDDVTNNIYYAKNNELRTFIKQ